MYIGHLLYQKRTSWVGSILVVFSSLVTIGVAAYLYHSFREFKHRNPRLELDGVDLEEGETEFEVGPGVRRKSIEREALVRRVSDDDFFFDEEHEIGN